MPSSSDSGSGSDSDNGSDSPCIDKFGNTITPAEKQENAKLELIRKEAKLRRVEKAAINEQAKADKAAKDKEKEKAKEGKQPVNEEEQYLALKAKEASGAKMLMKDKKLLKKLEEKRLLSSASTNTNTNTNTEIELQSTNDQLSLLTLKSETNAKMSNKEKKLLVKLNAKTQRELDFTLQTLDPLSQFTLAITGTSSTPKDESDGTKDIRQKDIVVKGVSISAPSKPLIVNADIKLIAGHRYGLIGANGRGKSTLLKFLAHKKLKHSIDCLLVEQESSVENVSPNATVLEQVIGADAETNRLKKREGELEVKLASTTDLSELDAISIELSAIGNALEAAGANTAESRALQILAGLGFDTNASAAPISKLSGGWKVRAALAAALLVAPSLLLLDEPTNHLDLDAVLWLEDFLSVADLDLTTSKTSAFRNDGIILTVSHDRDFLDATCTDLILLTDDGDLEYHRGGLARLEEGAGRRLAKRKKDYTLQQKTLSEEKSKHPSITKDKVEERVLAKLGQLRLVDKPREYKVDFNFGSPADHGAVSLRDVSFVYDKADVDGKDGVSTFSGFKNLNFEFDSRLRACIVGANGTGKSTLLKLLGGKLDPTSGERLIGQRVRIGYYDQHFSELLDDPNLSHKRKSGVDVLQSRYPTLCKDVQTARKILGQFGLDGERHIMPVDELSGGQKARVVLASLAMKCPHVLILDEPTNHLDIESIDALINGLRSYTGGVLAVTHDAALVEALSTNEDGVEQPLYVCEAPVGGIGETTVRLERGGFKKYRVDLQRRQAQREEEVAYELKMRAVLKAKRIRLKGVEGKKK